MSNEYEEYLNDCAEALANYLNCNKEKISIEEDLDEVIQSIYTIDDNKYKIALTEDIVDYINYQLLPDKIDEIESELKKRNLYDYIEDLDEYNIKEEILDNLEEYFESSYNRIPFKYNKQVYTIFKL